MSTITVTLREEHLSRLRDRAEAVGTTAEELVRANIEAWLVDPPADLDRITDYLLQKNRELYRRLA